MKRAIFTILIIFAAIFISGLAISKTVNKVALLSNDITQINTAPIAVSPKSQNQWRLVEMRVSAYCPCEKCCGQFSDWITASGHKIQPEETFVAADQRYPFGTEMIVPGYNNDKPVKVLDRGTIQGNHLDVFFTTHRQALNWGVKYLPVQVRTQ